jgi:transposase
MKRSMGISRDKNDKIDSARIATFAFEKAYKLKPSKLASEDILKLKQLQSERAMYVSERAKYKAYISDKCEKKGSTFKRMSLMVKALSQQIEEVETEIQSVIQRNEDLKTSYDLITSVPGVGKVIAISTLTHTNNFQSFSNARQYACYAGVAPFARTSGTSIHGAATVSRIGDTQIKAELSQGAMSARHNDPEMSVYAARKREEGKHPGVILNAIKFKLIERMFAVIHRGTPYVLTHEYKTMKNTAEGCHSGGRRKVSQERVFAS